MNKFIILIPVYNDWQSAFELITNIDNQIENEMVDVIIVNDASTEMYPDFSNKILKINSIKILNLIKNSGHGHAIATGLNYCNDQLKFDYLIPMDGDGEDRPEELKNFFSLVSNSKPNIITANRIKRSEGLIFKTLYFLHKVFTWLITGKLIKFGNYSCLSKDVVSEIITRNTIWLSFSGTLAKYFPIHVSILSIRGSRYFGPTKMSLFKLILHSLRISSVFRWNVIIRSILLILFALVLFDYYSSYCFLLIALFVLIFLGASVSLEKYFIPQDFKNYKKNISELTSLYSG
jgi:glycosyltransferase involved in cell wall biosynthesis